ncbi:hypothetical protein H0H93_011106 [Arthromyces matolae]|nr:hypothetical protein H0H93_011106 [Arthromyces matolae]
MSVFHAERLLTWFTKNGGSFDAESMGLVTFSDLDNINGAVALKDIPEGHVLFSIPRSLTLSTRTSSLPLLFGTAAWKDIGLHRGWAGLILCMMWESLNPASKWSDYLDMLPARFDTPMFWDEIELKELEGTSVVEKLGREEAEQSYTEKLLPAIKSRPDLFPPENAAYYSLANFHIMGSRILSRSFNVERWDSGEEEEETRDSSSHTRDHEMDVDSYGGPEEPSENDESHHSEAEEDEEDEEDSSDTAMVPMADMLNARYRSENAKLFDDEKELRMVSTKPIKTGEQIWNTYGDLPNAELLRRYGHVDLLPLTQGGDGNPGDVVEVRGDIALSVLLKKDPSLSEESIRERIDWWLEEGGDDVFVLEADTEVPELLISFIRLLLLAADEWESVKQKSKPPKPKIDGQILEIVGEMLEMRLKAYPTTLQEDQSALEGELSRNKRHAVIVRLGEKRILSGTLDMVRGLQVSQVEKGKNNKRKPPFTLNADAALYLSNPFADEPSSSVDSSAEEDQSDSRRPPRKRLDGRQLRSLSHTYSSSSNLHPLRSAGLAPGPSDAGVTRPHLSRVLNVPTLEDTSPGSPDLSATEDEKDVLIHMVTPGDSLAGVSLRYGISLADLRRANHLWASDSIHLRTQLYIPVEKASRLDPIPVDSLLSTPPDDDGVTGTSSPGDAHTEAKPKAKTSTQSFDSETIRRVPIAQMSFFPPPSGTKSSAIPPASEEDTTNANVIRQPRYTSHPSSSLTSLLTSFPIAASTRDTIIARLSFESTSSGYTDRESDIHELDDVSTGSASDLNDFADESQPTPSLVTPKAFYPPVNGQSRRNSPPSIIHARHLSTSPKSYIPSHPEIRTVQMEPSAEMQIPLLPHRHRSPSGGKVSAHHTTTDNSHFRQERNT